MYRIFHNTKYDFIQYWRPAVLVTALVILAGVVSFAVKPLRLSIEFRGGTLVQVEFTQTPPPTSGQLRAALDEGGIRDAQIQPFGNEREFSIRAAEASVGQQEAGAESVVVEMTKLLGDKFGAANVRINKSEAIGPRVGKELTRGAFLAVGVSMLFVLAYLAWRFEWRFGVAAVLATMHDVAATIAFIKLMNLEISLTVVAGILTVLGYSLNDTIIIFDRVRENLRKKRRESLYDTLNRSVNETLPRSVLTHCTTAAATLALLFFAGEVLRPFAWVMTFGIVVGTLSSIYIASPALLWIERKWPRQVGDRGNVGAISRDALRGDAPKPKGEAKPMGETKPKAEIGQKPGGKPKAVR